MQSNLYIPKKIKVGFQKRKDTFTGKLGFVTYIDDKGLLRQENAWNGWRDKSVEPVEYDNEPRSNFVFNKDINRSGHWSDITKVRIFDTRDFEFEIDVSNMMYILMHSDISKRDIAEECVFAWSGKTLILLPVNSEEYRNSVVNTKKQNAVFSFKNLILGHTYSTKKHGDVIYLGHHDWSQDRYVGHTKIKEGVGKKHIFYVEKSYGEKFNSLESKDLAEDISTEVNPKYAELVEKLHKSPYMKKTGKFTVTKGFEKEGYKKTSYEMYKVVVNEKANSNDPYTLYTVHYNANNDEPKITRVEQVNYYSHDDYKYEMREQNVNSKDPNQVRDFFIKKGFGVLKYKKSTGETVTVS